MAYGAPVLLLLRKVFSSTAGVEVHNPRIATHFLDTMRKLRRVLIGLGCLLGTLALAQAPVKCNSGPKSGWTTSDKLAKLLETKGYKVRRIGDMAGCYVVVGTNEKGEDGEFFFHPLTLGIVGSRLR